MTAVAVSPWWRRARCALGAARWLGALAATGCVNAPPTLRPESMALPATDARGTTIGAAISAAADAHPGESGIVALDDPVDALAARLALIDAAERTLDLQYFIWGRDHTGLLVMDALQRAATRGVRIRLLLDDLGTRRLDRRLATLDAHEQIEVRLFNPVRPRRAKWMAFITSPGRTSRRMHNKSFIADNQAGIVGGRNIGDEYFANDAQLQFTDLDVLVVGDVVPSLSADFDRYWASASSHPVSQLLGAARAADHSRLREAVARTSGTPDGRRYGEAVSRSPFAALLRDSAPPFTWARTQLVSDAPEKGLRDVHDAQTATEAMLAGLGTPRRNLTLITPYFVPLQAGVDGLAALERRGVDVRILTNSLDANDVAATHAGYAKRRRALLRAGVELFEARREERPPSSTLPPPQRLALHVKAVAVDGERLFVGSYNFDPRSARLNTEMGLVVESAEMAAAVDRRVVTAAGHSAYVVQLSDLGRVVWLEYRDGRWRTHQREPGASVWRRLLVTLLAPLPVDWLL